MNHKISFTFIVIFISLFSYGQDSTQVSKRFFFQDFETISNHTSSNTSQFNTGLVISFEELIQGRIPGLSVMAVDGSPNSSYTLTHRGKINSELNNQILIIVDNTILTNGNYNINPNDIESITLLKEASDTILFGASATNGVLLIQTKKGTADFTINYSGKLGVSNIQNKSNVLNSQEYKNLINSNFNNNPQIINALGNSNTDWQNEVYQTAYSQDHHIALSGSPVKIPMRLSIGNTKLNGITLNAAANKTTFNYSITPSLFNDYLKLQANIYAIDSEINYVDLPHEMVTRFDPTKSVTLTDRNPYSYLFSSKNQQNIKSLTSNINLDYRFHFWNDLRIIINYSQTKSDNNSSEIYDPQSVYNNVFDTDINYIGNNKSKQIDYWLNYTKEFTNSKNKLSFIIGHSSREINFTNSSNFIFPHTNNNNYYTYNKDFALSGLNIYINSFSESIENNTFSKASFNLKNRFLFNGTFSQTKNSFFGSDSPSNNIAYGFGWNLKNEKLFSNITNIKTLLIRLNSGETDISNSPTLYGQMIHEKTNYFSSGIEFDLLNHKLFGSFDYYSIKSHNLLRAAPLTLGQYFQASTINNNQSIRNSGFEITLNSQLLKNKDWSWTVYTNTSFNKNEIINSKTDIFNSPLIESNQYAQIDTIGHATNSFYLYEQLYNTDGTPIEGGYADRNNDGIITLEDRYIVGSADATIRIGIASHLTFKKWTFSFSGRYNSGNYIYNQNAVNSNYSTIYNQIGGTLNNVTPAILETQFNSSQPLSDHYLEKASFFKMDNISLAYQFGLLKNKQLATTISLAVQNAFTITDYTGQDPESVTGFDTTGTPRARTYSLGLKLNY